jgi:hypothetical protein
MIELFSDADGPLELQVLTALEWSAARLAMAFGASWHLLPTAEEITVTSRVGDVNLSRDRLSLVIRRLYTDLVDRDELMACCVKTVAYTEAMVAEGGVLSLSNERLEGIAAVSSYLSPGRMELSQATKVAERLTGLFDYSVSQGFLTNAVWEAHGCLMAALVAAAPRRYHSFLRDADFLDIPFKITAKEAISLRDACLTLPEYVRVIETLLRLDKTTA